MKNCSEILLLFWEICTIFKWYHWSCSYYYYYCYSDSYYSISIRCNYFPMHISILLAMCFFYYYGSYYRLYYYIMMVLALNGQYKSNSYLSWDISNSNEFNAKYQNAMWHNKRVYCWYIARKIRCQYFFCLNSQELNCHTRIY